MKLVGRIPVEPLDDERLTRIERRLVAGAAEAAATRPAFAPRRYLGVAAAALGAVVCAVIGWRLGREVGPAAMVAEPAAVRVDTTAERSVLDIGDARIHSDPTTQLVITRPAGGVLVELARGKVELEVGKRGDRAPLIVRAGDTDVVVVGTRFSVDYGDGRGEAAVQVTEGVVEVVRRAQRVRVAAGQAWTARGGRVALVALDRRRASEHGAAPTDGEPIVASADGERVVREAIAASTDDPTAGADGPELPTDAPTAGADDLELPTDAPDVLRGRTARVPGQRAGAISAGTGTGTGVAATASRDRPAAGPAGEDPRPPRTVDDPREPRRDLKKLIAAQPVAPALDVGADNPASAVAAYYTRIREATRTADGEAESRAFYSIAVLQHLRLARDADALRTLDRYFQRFARGRRYAEYPAALWLRVRIQCSRDLGAACQQAAAAYVRQAPDGPAARLAQRLVLDE